MATRISVFLADPSPLFRDGLRAHLSRETDFEVVGESGDGRRAFERILQVRPAVTLLADNLPTWTGKTVARGLLERRAPTRVLFTSAEPSDRLADELCPIGACGYVTRRASFATFRNAIREVAAGRFFVSEDVRRRLAPASMGVQNPFFLRSRLSLLTLRESEVLHILAAGQTTKVIARELHLSVRTVERHKSSLMKKLDIHDRVELARFAFREGLANP